jgi:hypothetical protein
MFPPITRGCGWREIEAQTARPVTRRLEHRRESKSKSLLTFPSDRGGWSTRVYAREEERLEIKSTAV